MGWYKESKRHSLASRGIKTGRNDDRSLYETEIGKRSPKNYIIDEDNVLRKLTNLDARRNVESGNASIFEHMLTDYLEERNNGTTDKSWDEWADENASRYEAMREIGEI